MAEWGRARGMSEERLAEWSDTFGDRDWSAAEASRRERWPGDAAIEIDVLRASTFAKVPRARRMEARGRRP